MVCCPCTVPCPRRSNGPASYGHCEATLYLRVNQGNYRSVNLNGMQMVEASGMCATDDDLLSALYLDRSSSPAQRSALMKLLASFTPKQIAHFLHVQVVTIDAHIKADHYFQVSIPNIPDLIVDRN